MELYYVQNEQRIGPLSLEAFREHVSNGSIQDNTLVWHKEMPNWEPYWKALPYIEPLDATVPAVNILPETTRTAPSHEVENEPNAALVAIRAFLSLNQKKIIFAGCFLFVAFVIKFANDHRKEWMEDAITADETVWDALKANGLLEKAKTDWTNAFSAFRDGNHEVANQHLTSANEKIQSYYYNHASQKLEDGKSFEFHVKENLKPFNEAISTEWTQVLDSFQSLEIDQETVAQFENTYSQVFNNTLYQQYSERAEQIDQARASLATNMIRIHFVDDYYFDSEEASYHDYLTSIVRKEINSKLVPPDGFNVAYGAAAGYAEFQATFLTFSISLTFEHQGYNLKLTDESENLLVPSPEDKFYMPEFEVIKSATVKLFDFYDGVKPKNQPLTSWEPYKEITIKMNTPLEIPISKKFDDFEKEALLNQYNRACCQRIARGLKKHFKLPPIKISGYPSHHQK